ncbi:NACHT domain-containing protein [Motilimonas eburnea]|uniref:NACHT domain-containing protein n=1 Tax=Motilimonas eburnea TaxID=1737488 RepID=UPI001E59ECE8|nr:hypothetical protein [Motilimonas eburnea]MCE2571828.1 hypothetical protein [Motilimonas eburnea]
MNQPFYLERRLSVGDNTYTETELLETSNYIVILAEPGAGKTELLKSLAKKLGVKEVTASAFRYKGPDQAEIPLVIDAFDELAKVDSAGIYELLAQVCKAEPTKVIISSRSSEWAHSATNNFEQFLGHAPLLVRICEFDDSEQQEIYTHHLQKGDFAAFRSEVARFALEPILPNPQFLKMFADAYTESNGHFTDKRSIFTQAVTRLAKEANPATKTVSPLSIEDKVILSSEIFAKLLLSGTEGVGVSEASEDRMYPLLSSLLNVKNVGARPILATRLFKPGDHADQHRPVHKIVAEYCAASYLVKRISCPSDPLTLIQCLPIIAPNSTVRDELRGLLGWMASLGDNSIQERAIELDPYAVLANGDPSQLTPSSKRLLISRLKQVEASDPYFRRGDFWRRFSVVGFFTKETIDEIKPIITDDGDGHLKNLLLELLVGSKAEKWLVIELRELLLAPGEKKHVRFLAKNCLLNIDDYNFRSDLKALITEATHSSLHVAADAIVELGPDTFSPSELEVFFRSCFNLYPNHRRRFEGTLGGRYFVKRLIDRLNLETIEWLLDSMSKDLACTCGKEAYECDCRTGISKIMGSMLDRYCELAKPPFEALRIWQWIENLNFPGQVNTQDIISVKFLQQNQTLRQEIIAHVFGQLADRDRIFHAEVHVFGGHYSHAGLRLNLDDVNYIVDLAFKNNNLELWINFLPRHHYHHAKGKLGPDYLRRKMRLQALQKPEFMRAWALQNRQTPVWEHKDNLKRNAKHRRRMKRKQRKDRLRHTKNINYVQNNRALVESGRHWGYLVRFAELVLYKPERIETEFGDEQLVRNALKNCLDFVEPHVPNLKTLAELQCASKGLYAETILFAACLEILRDCGNLEGVKPSLLKALRTNLQMNFDAVEASECDALKAEVDRLIFPDTGSAEQFLREYLEPQLTQPQCLYPEVDILIDDEIFSPLRAKLSIDWLERFNTIGHNALNSLFNTAVDYGTKEQLKQIIRSRCSELLPSKQGALDDELKQSRKFWFVRAFYFLNLEEAEPYFNWLKSDKNSVLLFNEYSGRFSDYSQWPMLTSNKVEAILDALPKVHLPSSYGTHDPIEEKAYRFLKEIVWSIGKDNPDEAIPVLGRLLADPRFADIHRELKSIQAEQFRKKALRDFEPPAPKQIVDLLDNNAVVTVEGLRQLVLQELLNYQKDINGGEFNAANRFYKVDTNGNDINLGEVASVEIVAERLSLALTPKSIIITSEHQTKNQNRIDITASKVIDGKRRLLVIEAKGQWHKDLYSAASAQLFERYSIHPDAEHQGIYLVIWFGENVKVEQKQKHGIKSAQQLKSCIEATLPAQLKGLIDVFVLDVSKPSKS